MQGTAISNETNDFSPAQGAAPGAVRTWNGPLSDVSFRSEFAQDVWQMTMLLEAEIPVVIQLAFETPEQLQEITDVFDFSLAVARTPGDFSDQEVSSNALSLMLCRDRFLDHSIEIYRALDERGPSFDIGGETRRNVAANKASAAALYRIASRINDRLIAAVGGRAPDLIAPEGGSGTFH